MRRITVCYGIVAFLHSIAITALMLTHRLATETDLDLLRALMTLAIDVNQRAFLSPAELAVSGMTMGIDTQLISDRTYFLVEEDGTIVGCGGWSYRATTHGGDLSSVARDITPLDPARDPARIRAMYTHPDHVRCGIGRLVLSLCESAARDAGFASTMMVATLSGEPLYRAAGYTEVERTPSAPIDGVRVPLIVMQKRLG